MAPEEWAHKRAGLEKDLAKAASSSPLQAEHYGIAAGLLATTKQEEHRAEAVRLLLYGPRYRGEALRRFAEGTRFGELLYKAVTDYADGETADGWSTPDGQE